MRGGYCYKPEQRERAPCRARTACWYGSSVGVKRVHRSEKREGGGEEKEDQTRKKIERRSRRECEVRGSRGQKVRNRASERASQPASQSDQPANRARERREDVDDESPTRSEQE